MARVGVGIGLVAVALGCGSNSGNIDSLTSHPRSSAPLAWQGCPRLPPLPDEPPGQCSKNRVPLFWNQPDAGEIDIVVRRFPTRSPRRGTLWMLAGGPGGTGAVFNTPAWRGLADELGYDLMIPTPRGSGLSTPLSCPEQEGPDSELGAWVSSEEFGPCAAELAAKWGRGLAGFASLETARDLLHLIEREKRAGEQTALWGGSYGSFWAQRLLELAPQAVDAVILEGLVPSDTNFLDLSANVDEAARELLRQCGDVPGCAGRFSTSPSEAAASVVASDLAGNGCAARAGFDLSARQRLLAAPFLADVALRPLLAPLVLRLARCSQSDQAELGTALERFPDLSAAPQPTRSLSGTLLDPLVQNLRLASLIIHADLIREDRALANIDTLENGLLASRGQSRTFLREHGAWPRDLITPRTPLDARTDVAMLMFGGGLDGQTPLSWSKRVGASFSGPQQRLVIVPTAGHMTYELSRTTDGDNCTVSLWRAFLRDPAADLDTSCLDRVIGFDLVGEQPETRALAQKFLGTDNVWGTPD